MATVQEVITGAMHNLLLTTSGEDIEAEDMAASIDILNDMFADWSINFETGYTRVSIQSDPVTIPDSILMAVKQNLALDLAPIFTVQPSPALQSRALRSYRRMVKKLNPIIPSDYPDTLPMGSGNTDGTYWHEYVYYPDNVPEQGLLSLVSNATATTISTVDTPVLVAGTWVVGDSINFTLTTAGRMTYQYESVRVKATAVLSVTCASTKSVRAMFYKNGAPLTSSAVIGKAGTVPASISLEYDVDLAKNDYLEVYIENQDSTDNVTVQSAQFKVAS